MYVQDFQGPHRSVGMTKKPGKTNFPIFRITRFKFRQFIFLAAFILFTLPSSNAHSALVSLVWDPSTDPNVAGYRVYYGTSRGSYFWVIDVGKASTCTISNLAEGTVYFIAATGYDSSAIESDFSDKVVYPPGALADTIAKLSIYRRGEWFKDLNNNGTWDGWEVDICIESFGGIAVDIPFTK